MTRKEIETIFAKVLLNEEVSRQDLCEAIALAIRDVHKMAEIEEVVKE